MAKPTHSPALYCCSMVRYAYYSTYALGVEDGAEKSAENDLACRDLKRRQVGQVVFHGPLLLKKRAGQATSDKKSIP